MKRISEYFGSGQRSSGTIRSSRSATSRVAAIAGSTSFCTYFASSSTSAGVGKLQGELEPLVDEFVDAIFALETANRDHPDEGDILEEAKYVQTTVLPAMQAVRDVADKLERIVPDDLWPLPKYSEILFIK